METTAKNTSVNLDFDVKKQEQKQRIAHILREILVYFFLAIFPL